MLLHRSHFVAGLRHESDGLNRAPTEMPARSLREEIVTASRERYGTAVAEIDAALELALGKKSVSAKPLGDEVVAS